MNDDHQNHTAIAQASTSLSTTDLPVVLRGYNILLRMDMSDVYLCPRKIKGDYLLCLVLLALLNCTTGR
jgi:hypothetical protein